MKPGRPTQLLQPVASDDAVGYHTRGLARAGEGDRAGLLPILPRPSLDPNLAVAYYDREMSAPMRGTGPGHSSE